MELKFRDTINQTDVIRVREIVESTGFFRDDETDVAVELVTEALEMGQTESGYFLIFAENNGETAGFVCFGPTPCTMGTFDLYWIVVDEKFRGHGIGKRLVLETEKALKEMSARKLYIETSSTVKYKPTRVFYLKCGYTEEARLKDFYNPGDDKVIYAKYL